MDEQAPAGERRLGSDAVKMRRRAFSLVELVAVLVVVGLLGAAALTRFTDLSSDAYASNFTGTAGAFREAVKLVHAKWIARGASAKVDAVAAEGGTTIGVNDAGWPENALAAGGDGAVTASECADLWKSILSSSPSISTTAGAASWLASAQGTTTCRYVYDATGGRELTYDTLTGVVSTTSAPAVVSIASTPSTPSPSLKSVPVDDAAEAIPASAETKVACGLIGPEPFVALALARLARSRRRPRPGRRRARETA